MIKIAVERGDVERLRQTVQDLADFPDTITGFFIAYHTMDDRVRGLYKTTNASELIGDISRILYELNGEANDIEEGNGEDAENG